MRHSLASTAAAFRYFPTPSLTFDCIVALVSPPCWLAGSGVPSSPSLPSVFQGRGIAAPLNSPPFPLRSLFPSFRHASKTRCKHVSTYCISGEGAAALCRDSAFFTAPRPHAEIQTMLSWHFFPQTEHSTPKYPSDRRLWKHGSL